MSNGTRKGPFFLITVAIASLLILFFVARWLIQQVSNAPGDLGEQNGRLAPCPDSPNCVSSFAEDPEHSVAPLTYAATQDVAHDALLNVIADIPRSEVVVNEPDYVHVVFRSPTLGFSDDGEFLFDPENSVIHMRMAARLGYDDLNANRKRAETIRAALAAELGE